MARPRDPSRGFGGHMDTLDVCKVLLQVSLPLALRGGLAPR